MLLHPLALSLPLVFFLFPSLAFRALALPALALSALALHCPRFTVLALLDIPFTSVPTVFQCAVDISHPNHKCQLDSTRLLSALLTYIKRPHLPNFQHQHSSDRTSRSPQNHIKNVFSKSHWKSLLTRHWSGYVTGPLRIYFRGGSAYP